MKVIAAALLAIALASCASAVVAPTINGLSGRWYSGQAQNRTDYRLNDCLYLSDGTFKCVVFARGCSDGNCEAESFAFSGTWVVEGVRLTRQCITGLCSRTPQTWTIERQDRKTLTLSGEERWHRMKGTRDRLLMSDL